ncbi:hypothetical protein FPE01S_01_04100 [Flavihumibacter petaseus NBRC 106054]|uniref:DUF6242 domain-containing protein n=2 Tax=Flavihumibacter TaxID=1004301 RepID=A0A0E9MV97_9BACT|nr:hypothetical protein FPE01S_01_04100 [Flavihumibacter petaseus NBRC 106054]
MAGCEKDDPPLPDYTTGEIELAGGDNQSGVFGEMLADPIRLNVHSKNPNDRFYISYKHTQGNGYVGQDTLPGWFPVYADSANPEHSVKWRLGCDNTTQKVTFYLHPFSISNPLTLAAPVDSVTVSASATKPAGWCRACGYGSLDFVNSKVITYDQQTLYMVNNKLYVSTDGGLNWYPVTLPFADQIVDAQFNSKGWMYLVTQNEGVYYSADKQHWQAINGGLIDRRDPTGFLAEDNSLFISFYFDGPYRSTDNGSTWQKMVVGNSSERQYGFTRHPDGRLLMLDKWNDLYVSGNNGDTWQKTELPYKYRNYQVYDLQVDATGKVYTGAGDATLSVFDLDSFEGETHSHYEWNANAQSVTNITLAPGDIFYQVNYNPAPGVYSKSANWGRLDLGFGQAINYYFRKQNGKFLLGSNNFLYFRE